MRFASSITASTKIDQAVEELLTPIDARVTPGMVDLVLLFSTAQFNEKLPQIIDRVGQSFPGAVLVGCTAEGTIGYDRELEQTPSISLLVASLPEVRIRPFLVTQRDLASINDPLDWERIVAAAPESRPTFIAFADPFRLAIHDFVELISDAFPGAPLVGGVATAAREPLQNRLVLNGEIYREGLVGVTLTGRLDASAVVSQGCRPIGTPFVVTKAERNVIRELGGQSALEQLHQVLTGLAPEDELLAKQALLMGRVIDEYKERFTLGDFLIHNIIGVNRKTGALGIAGLARVGTTVQFHVCDPVSADEDLRAMLAPYAGTGVRGAALFGCHGRGTHMWPKPGHDVSVLREILGDVPVAGFFCGGEFGPIGARNFVHSFAASIALFREPEGQ